MTKFQLLTALTYNNQDNLPVITDTHGRRYCGRIQSILREDGSGKSFMVHMDINGQNYTIHVQTID